MLERFENFTIIVFLFGCFLEVNHRISFISVHSELQTSKSIKTLSLSEIDHISVKYFRSNTSWLTLNNYIIGKIKQKIHKIKNKKGNM